MELEDIPDSYFGNDYFSFHDGDEDAVNRVCGRISQLPTSVPLQNIMSALPQNVTAYTITTQTKNCNNTGISVQHIQPRVVESNSALSSALAVTSPSPLLSTSVTSASETNSTANTSASTPHSTSSTLTKVVPPTLPRQQSAPISSPQRVSTTNSIRAIRPEGATIRSGPDIDNSSIIDRLQCNEVARVLATQLLKPTDIDCVAVTRLHIQFERRAQTIEGWVSLTGRTVEDHQPIVEYITANASTAPKSQLIERCPICDYLFGSNDTLRDREVHVNECLAKL